MACSFAGVQYTGSSTLGTAAEIIFSVEIHSGTGGVIILRGKSL
jgi:hypothetical protein